MKRWVVIFAWSIAGIHFLEGQTVLYSPFINDRFTNSFEVSGKTTDYYWVLKEGKQRNKNNHHPLQSFDLFDSKLRFYNHIQVSAIPENSLKTYLVAGKNYFDRMQLLQDSSGVRISVQRFLQDGFQFTGDKTIFQFPFSESGNSFLLVRSEDKSKILILCFQSVPDAAPHLHALLMDDNWHILLYKEYRHPSLSQPVIQDDFTSYPIEYFSNIPVQLANSGQWLMCAPSRTDNNFLLFHFCEDGTGFSYKTIRLPAMSELDDLALTINNAKGEAFAGLLSKFHYQALKNVQVVHYSMEKQDFDFDSSYRFSTLPGKKYINEHLVHESFVAVPESGFLLLKEYGKAFSGSTDDNYWDPETFFANSSMANHAMLPLYANSEGYVKFNQLAAAADQYQRGDLNLFYFPSQRGDSCWSALISKQQTTEMNSPNLSYVLYPDKDRLALLYNSFINDEDQYGSSTMLDRKGNMVNEGGVIFWKFNTMLNFQQSRQIGGKEIAVPYRDDLRKGFAIIRF